MFKSLKPLFYVIIDELVLGTWLNHTITLLS